MFRISSLARIFGSISEERAQNFTELPSGLNTGLMGHLMPGEEIKFTLRDFRAIYKAPRWLDSNTFFNSWFILTSHRIVIARNSSSFKKFRDIPYTTINQVDYERGVHDYKVTIHSPGTVDIIEFTREMREHCEGLDSRLNQALEDSRNISGTIYCSRCGTRIPKESRFCFHCGHSLQDRAFSLLADGCKDKGTTQ